MAKYIYYMLAEFYFLDIFKESVDDRKYLDVNTKVFKTEGETLNGFAGLSLLNKLVGKENLWYSDTQISHCGWDRSSLISQGYTITSKVPSKKLPRCLMVENSPAKSAGTYPVPGKHLTVPAWLGRLEDN